jgi:hypothetical protein
MLGTHDSADNVGSIEDRYASPHWPLFVALGVGIMTALFSISLEHRVALLFGDAGFIIAAVVFPGLLGSMAIAGNVHAFSLWIAAGINFIFYFTFVWIICAVSIRIVRRFR